jgi:toxin FitB
VVSELRKPKPYGAVVAWLQNLELGQGFFSAVTFGEIQKGVELTRRQDPTKANDIEGWAAQLERTSQVLSMDAACFREYARLIHRRSDTLEEDAMIAATARVYGLTVATRNERDFAHFKVPVLNPFRHRAP